MMRQTKDVVVGLGEIGKPILQLLSKKDLVVGYDINEKLMDVAKFNKYSDLKASFMHICIPFTKKFESAVIEYYKKFKPMCIVVHSTIRPYTTKRLQERLPIPVIYSATRGIHRRMLYDLKRYAKFYSIEKGAPNEKWASTSFEKMMKNVGVTTKKLSKPITLELAKIVCDTSYYGWLITYSQISNMIAMEHGADYDEMWSFSDEIHKFLGNRPKMYPGFIGGHCIIPNLELIDNEVLNLIDKINKKYAKLLKLG
jgi:hypothetical protein